MATKSPNPKNIKFRSLKIKNFKAIDELLIDFQEPRMRSDPEVLVMGSQNGLGKTSVLEACAMLFLGIAYGAEKWTTTGMLDLPVNLTELFVRAGTNQSTIQGNFQVDDSKMDISILINRNGTIKIEGNTQKLARHLIPVNKNTATINNYYLSLAGMNVEPIILPSFLYFNSYRKIQEGNPELGMLFDDERIINRHPALMRRPRLSTFKLQILRIMMGQANLFETLDTLNQKETLEKLNSLVKRYAGGTIEKLRTSPDNTIEFRISPTSGGQSYAFDGLSSGQKEIISTLFLIWFHTHEQPGIVLIDEPELHLNPEWHLDLVQQLFQLVPDNQYIIATHSEDIFGSVSPDHRIILQASSAANPIV
ncbi:MAG: AAA family ATPase [Magnetococcales bacterium]|nr:AAA family ATPase [Magnetococcales bacterium]